MGTKHPQVLATTGLQNQTVIGVSMLYSWISTCIVTIGIPVTAYNCVVSKLNFIQNEVPFHNCVQIAPSITRDIVMDMYDCYYTVL